MRAFNVRLSFACAIAGLAAAGPNRFTMWAMLLLLFTYGMIELCEWYDRFTGRKS